LQVLVWRGDTNLRTLVSKDDRKFFCALLGIENTDAPPSQGKKRPHDGGAAAASATAASAASTDAGEAEEAPANGDSEEKDIPPQSPSTEGSAPKRARQESDDVDEVGGGDAVMEE
jgi:hypothetical protein